MGFLSRIFNRDHPSGDLKVDLGTFEFGASQIGEVPAEADFFAQPLRDSGVLDLAKQGIELRGKDGRLDSAFLTLETFGGEFSLHGSAISLGPDTREAEVIGLFGEPYWIDRSDGEVILFYEYAQGALELQFEFPESEGLGFITVAVEGILSDEKQRSGYGVNKPWPPA